MNERSFTTETGHVLTDNELNALAEEAERGYDVTKMVRRPGRPRMGSAPAAPVPVRMPEDLHEAVKALAEAEETSVSELVRDALSAYLRTEVPPQVHDLHGQPDSEAAILALVEEAESGYPLGSLQRRRGSRRKGRARVFPVRMSPELQSAVEARAEAEMTSVSEVVRAALRARLENGGGSGPPGGGGAHATQHSPTEADTCRDYVLPRLKEAGWDESQIVEQYRITDGRITTVGKNHRRAMPLRADYVLEYRPGLPIAVVEAKRYYAIPGKGMQQARRYAGLLDVPFAYATNGRGIVEDDRNTGIERADMVGFPSPDALWARYREWRGINESPAAGEGLLIPFNRDLRNPDGSVKEPRYYQRTAVNRAVASTLKGDKRLLLTMATGTGKTFVAMQIVWKLWNVAWRPGRNPRILYLADRNILIDQPIEREFKPAFGSGAGSPIWKLQGEAKLGREIYFGLYQQLAETRSDDPMFRRYPKDYFDLIIVDECHRGSARAESSWRAILEYFASATQIGMTATPKRDETVDTYDYFGGKPLFEYTLASGIEDGFLAPYRVRRVVLSPDALGWTPTKGQLDLHGREVPAGLYSTKDFERVVSLLSRTEAAAKHLTDYLRRTDRMAKTIVFCVDQEHADQMRRAIHNANRDLTKEHPNYTVRIVSDEGVVGQGHLSDFADTEREFPVIATTSEMLSTGVDVPTVRNIVIFRTIGSMALFKQVIGRGTRLFPDEDKLSFEIIDYSGATALFSDAEFDGPPEKVVREEVDEHGDVVDSAGSETTEPETEPAGPAAIPSDPGITPEDLEGEPHSKFYIDDAQVWVTAEATYQLDSETNRLRLVAYRDFVAETVRALFPEPTELHSLWMSRVGRKDVLEALMAHGIDADEMIDRTGLRDADPLDVLVHLAWNQPLRSRLDRAQRVRRDRVAFFEEYQPAAREVLTALLEKYAQHGITELDDLHVLQVPPLSKLGTPAEIASRFGSPAALRAAVARLSELVYVA
ncbi:DEAD/DEAH box helicase family protein [Nocardioides sp. HDW12B]|uniref:EcoAI/FtnUII family type I restriction enzme subunit R n=1 Tax=Nocardioides sp. HDW12B TaxID=2714939 RepID=UPI00140ECD5A|nr:DEAD/DEAH box helicase family protein [Nocardioides sp. HDW12B]QIK65625.1 DEAD/DEAH box helicase family protein [Nocardioides sp. HDW12B]